MASTHDAHPRRCELKARVTVNGNSFVAQCVDAEGHPGDCTVIDPNAQTTMKVRRSGTKW